MAVKILVVDPVTKKPTGERLKKTVALSLVCRDLAEWCEYKVSIFRKTIREAVCVLLAEPSLSIAIPALAPPLDWYWGFGHWPRSHGAKD